MLGSGAGPRTFSFPSSEKAMEGATDREAQAPGFILTPAKISLTS